MQIFSLDKTMDGDSGLFSGANGFNHCCRTGDSIAAGKNIRIIGLKGHRINAQGPPVTEGACAFIRETRPV